MYELVLLSLLALLRNALRHAANDSRQPLKHIILPRPRQQQVECSQPDDLQLEIPADISQLHYLAQSLARSQYQAQRQQQGNRNGGHKRPVLPSLLAEGTSGVEHDAGEDVFKARNEEEGCVLRVLDVGFLVPDFGRDEPGLLADGDEGHSLDGDADEHLP